MVTTFLQILHVLVCCFLMFVVLLQQGKSGGMGAAFGGGASQQVFGGRGAGNILTRATAICAAVFMLTSVSLAYFSSSGDRAMKARIIEEQRKGKGNEGTRIKAAKHAPAPSGAPAAPASTDAPIAPSANEQPAAPADSPAAPPTDKAPGTGEK